MNYTYYANERERAIKMRSANAKNIQWKTRRQIFLKNDTSALFAPLFAGFESSKITCYTLS